MKNKPRTILKSFANPRQYGKLQAIIFVIIFAAAGVTYLVASHASTPSMSVLVQGQSYPGNWYKQGTRIEITWSTFCIGQTSTGINVKLSGQHVYRVYKDDGGNPYFEVDSGPISPIAGVNYGCNPDTPHVSVWGAELGVDATPPTIGFSTANFTATTSSITVTGSASDADSGLASVAVNGVAATLSGSNFTATVPLSIGANSLVATATDHVGNSASSGTMHVVRTAPVTAGGSSGTTPSGGGSSSGSSGSGGSHPTSKGTSSGSSGGSGSGSAPATTPDTSSNPSSSDTGTNLGDTATTIDVAPGSTANVPAGQTSKLTSSDGIVTVTFPSGTFDTDAYCSIDAGDSNNVPPKTTNAIGPYSIYCTDSNGDTLNFGKSVTVAVKLPSGNNQYAAYESNNTTWTKLSSATSQRTLSFKLAKAEEFAVARPKGSNLGSIILNIAGGFIVLLLILVGIAWLRRRGSNIEAPDATVDSGNW